jgi:hypothetical protein
VADLTSLGAADAPGLAVGVGRHVVVVHEPLLVLGSEGVEHLVHARHAERADVEHLRLAPLEQAGAVRRGQDADLGGDGPEIGGAAAVDADALVDDALADQVLLEAARRLLDLLVAPLELAAFTAQRLDERCDRGVGGVVAIGLEGDATGGVEVGGAELGDLGQHVVAVVERRLPLHGLAGAGLGDQLELEVDGLTDPGLGGVEATGQDVLGDLGGA